MQVKTTRLGVATYLVPDGALTEENLPDLEAAVLQARAVGASQLVIDLSRVPCCDSRGLEFVTDLAESLRTIGGALHLAQPGPLCTQIFTITRLEATIPIHPDLASAARSFL
jgi:anti-sigma B factor antagonist